MKITLGDVQFEFISQIRPKITATAVDRGTHFKFVASKPLTNPTFVKITHIPSNRTDICLEIFPSVDPVCDGNWLVYETHVLSADKKTLYLAIENTNLKGFKDQENVHIYQPIIDLGVSIFGEDRYKRLPYTAPDKIADVNASQLAQHLPLWTKKAGAVTSSSVSRFLGSYIPEPYKDTEWTIKTKKKFDGWLGVAVRFGCLSEKKQIMTYLEHYPDRTFYQTGYTVHPEHPTEWGASPDGLIYCDGKLDRVIEFKASRRDEKFHWNYIPQVIWEMECLGVDRGDLVRYCERKGNNNVSETICRVVTIERDDELFREIKKLVADAKEVERSGDSLKFRQLVHSEPYVAMRSRLTKMATAFNVEKSDENPTGYTSLAIPREKLDAMDKHICAISYVEPPEKDSNIEERHAQICSLINTPKSAELRDLVLAQVKEYLALLD